MLGEDLGEQKLIREYLKKSIKNDLLSQSYIFESNNELESYNMAIDFARDILTDSLPEQKKREMENQIMSLNHPDLHIYEPEKNIIKRDKIDDLIGNAYRKSYYKGKKIFIIKEAEKMNLSSANTLLKTLEEPVSDIVIILLVKNISLLLSTITSRCQILKFKTENLSKIYVKEDNGRLEYFDLFEKIVTGNALIIYELEKYFEKKKDDINNILDLFELYLRDIAYYKMNSQAELVNFDKIDNIRSLSNKFSFERIGKIIDGLQQLKSDVQRNVNYKFITDSLVFIIQEES